MTVLNARGQRVELLSDAGEVLAIVFSQEEHRRLQAEQQRLQTELAASQRELAALKEANAAIEAERDGYLQSLHHLLREDFTFSAEEIANLMTNGIPARDVLRELEDTLSGVEQNGNRP